MFEAAFSRVGHHQNQGNEKHYLFQPFSFHGQLEERIQLFKYLGSKLVYPSHSTNTLSTESTTAPPTTIVQSYEVIHCNPLLVRRYLHFVALYMCNDNKLSLNLNYRRMMRPLNINKNTVTMFYCLLVQSIVIFNITCRYK